MGNDDETQEAVTPELSLSMRAYNNRLKQERTSLGLTQIESADAIGISTNKLGIYERLGKFPSMRDAIKISNFYNQQVDYFFPNLIKFATLCLIAFLINSLHLTSEYSFIKL